MRLFASVRPAMFEGLRFKHWKTNVGDDGIVVLTFDREGASANALSREVLDELDTSANSWAVTQDSVMSQSAEAFCRQELCALP